MTPRSCSLRRLHVFPPITACDVLRLVPFFGVPEWRPSEYCETGGAPTLNGRCSIVRHNNQLNDGVGWGGGHWRGDAHGRNAWGRTFAHRFGWRIKRRKNQNREGNGASDCDGSLLHGMTQKPTESRPYRWGLFGRGSAQCRDDWGGRGHTFLASGLRGIK